jgi:hypothetical protein
VTGCFQSARERADYVGEAAGFCMKRGFGRNDRYLHKAKRLGFNVKPTVGFTLPWAGVTPAPGN